MKNLDYIYILINAKSSYKKEICIIKIDNNYEKILFKIKFSEIDGNTSFYIQKNPITQIILFKKNNNIIEIKEII